MQQTVRVILVGTGNMAQSHADAYSAIEQVEVVAGVDTNASQLKKFSDKNAIQQQFLSVEDAIKWGEFDAASIATPDGVHYQTALPLIAADKHILCEKPLATTFAEAAEMAEKAADKGIIHSVNLTYREVPALQNAAKLVAAGTIGNIRHFEASYHQSWLTQPAWGDWKTESQWLWRLSTEHGSNGVLGDVGIHILDYATFVLGGLPVSLSAQLHTFDKAPGNTIKEYKLDANDSVVMIAQMDNGALGTITATRFASGHHNDLRLRLYGDEGGLEVLFEKGVSELNGCFGDDLISANWREIECPEVPTNYKRFIDAIRQKQSATPDFHRGAELQKLLDSVLNNK